MLYPVKFYSFPAHLIIFQKLINKTKVYLAYITLIPDTQIHLKLDK